MGKRAAQTASEPARKGAAGFETHYSGAFAERWPALKRALLADNRPVVRANGFAQAPIVAAEPWASNPLPEVSGCFVSEHSQRIAIARDSDGLLTGYIQDPASVLAARLLDAPANSRVLDLCAAPGGKSLLLAERFAATGELVLNDRSPDRKKRLLQVLKDYVPEAVRARIRVHQHDGRLWGKHQPDTYDAILLDAPCSSEQHVLCDPTALSEWSAKRIQRLSREQLALLRSAVTALRPAGQLVYCTCALAPQENDEIIEELLERDDRVRVLETRLPIGEATRQGWHVLPDTAGFGPLFVARLVRQD
jgi:16S rRNA C967 or C1407 C5-methylase (RsmB/RsmF family)